MALLFLILTAGLITNTVSHFFFISDNTSCGKNEFSCSNGSCINNTKLCDGNKDCSDGTDEVNCDMIKCLTPDYHKCDSSKCIPVSFVCDKENDCADGSDESHCHDKSLTKPCTKEEFKCSDGACIPLSWHCDRVNDCDDDSDEDMEECRKRISCNEGFLCSNLHCVSKKWRCDGKDDCGDGSDETHCDFHLIEPDQCLVRDRQFLCHDHKKCIDIEDVCNNNNDCLDASDEGGLCNNLTSYKKECKAMNCSGTFECLRKPHGILCACPKGTYYANNTCLDINECEEYGTCDQFCLNSYGTYICSCDPEYELIDNHKCKVKGEDPVLVYSSLRQIKVLNLVTLSTYILVDKLHQATGLAVDVSNIYWTIIYEGMQAIVTTNKNDTTPEIIVTSGLGTPENLAIDSITQNLYFTDAKMKHIGVCKNDGTVCTVLHNKNIDKPRAIAVSPMDGYMYWTDWGENPMIARSGMDGSQPQQFITQDIHWPNGVHVDYQGKRIYWVDAKMQIIESAKLDASDRRIVISQSVDHPFSVTVFEDKLYWSDWSGREIKVCNKFTGKDQVSLVHESRSRVYGMQIFHPSLFNKSQTPNPCVKAKCSDICLLAPIINSNSKGYTCACPDDKRLSSEELFCYDTVISPTIIVGRSSNILEIEHEHLGRQKIKELPLKNKIFRISAIAYNSISGNIVIYDSKLKKLFTYDLIKMKLLDLPTSEIGSLYSLKFDNRGNNLYWCDRSRRTLEVLSLTTNTRTTILNEFDGHIPIAVALVPDKGFMFVAMKYDYRIVHIDRIDMDGNIKSLVHTVEFGLVADEICLHFDMLTRRLYFTDVKNGVIDSVNENGMDRKLIQNSGFVTDIVSMNNEIFWVSQGSNALNWMNKNSNDRSYRILDMENWKSESNLCLTVVNDIDKEIQHPCRQNNGGCSHLCILSGKEKVCSCPLGLVLSNNGLTCVPQKQCKSDEYRCSTGECILSHFRCDSKQDCPRGDDEDVIKCLNFVPKLCPISQFLCHDKTKCLDNKLKCNGIKECNDGSDEKECGPKNSCDPNKEYLCSTGECIQISFLCDGHQDCSNGQDELNCQNQTCHHMEFKCMSGTCIAAAWECDGEIDCVDGSDEHNTCATKKCKADQFLCSNSRCISHQFTCNGEDDCDDNSDEIGCLPSYMFMTKPIKLCNEEKEFQCETKHGYCVPIEARCNKTSECNNLEDELNCGCQKSNLFECDNKRCVPKDWLCDKIDDCGDRSDENSKTCNLTLQHSQVSKIVCDGYLCKNKECIPLDRVCDHKIDCKDGTDEGDLCGLSCKFMNCSHICQETPKGGKCICYLGYAISHDGTVCTDINECKDNNNPCTQYCTNLDGSFSCNCLNSDYMLRADKSSCKALGPTMKLIYSEADQIRSTSGDLKESKLLFSKPGNQITDLDIDIRRNLIYWTSEEAGTLNFMDMNIQQDHKVYIKDLINPTLVRIDWLTENIYFIENHRSIVVCNLNVKHCATIYNANIHAKIKAFAIDPQSGLMFWAESIWAIWNSPTTVIRQSDCSGQNVKTIIDQELHDITDLTIDPIKRMVYWIDMVSSSIERAYYDGSKRNMLIYTNHFPKKISLYEDKMFWTNDATGYSIFKCKVFGITNIHCESVPLQIFSPIGIFMISQQAKQINASNICNKVHCDFICTSGSKGPMCICEDGSQVYPGTFCGNKSHKNSSNTGIIKSKTSNGNKISFYVALFIIVILGLTIIYYYLYRKNIKPSASLSWSIPLTISRLINRRNNTQHQHNVRAYNNVYENPINGEGLRNDTVTCEVLLNYNEERLAFNRSLETHHTSSSIAEFEENDKKNLIVFS